VFPDETVGYLSPKNRSFTAKLGGSIEFAETPATFEELPVILSCALEADTGGTTEGSGYLYRYRAATSSIHTPNTLTIEAGDNQQEEQMTYCYVESFTLSGEAGGPLNVGARWRGRQVATGTFTSALSLLSVEEIPFSKGKLYIDANTVGTNLKSNTLLGVRLEVPTGQEGIHAADGELYFSTLVQKGAAPTLQLTFEHDSTATTEIEHFRQGNTRLFRLEWEGTALNTAGTTYDSKTLRIDMAGIYENVEAITDQDGNNVRTINARIVHDDTSNLFFDTTIVNERSSL